MKDNLLKKNKQNFENIYFLVLSMLELLQHQRDESTEKHEERNHGRNLGTNKRNTGFTKERTLALQVSF